MADVKENLDDDYIDRYPLINSPYRNFTNESVRISGLKKLVIDKSPHIRYAFLQVF